MLIREARNWHQALKKGIHLLLYNGEDEARDIGDCQAVLDPVTFMVLNPRERVQFDPVLDVNPFTSVVSGLASIVNPPAASRWYEVRGTSGNRFDARAILARARGGFMSDNPLLFSVADGRLEATVLVRDLRASEFPNEAMMLSFLLEYLATDLGVPPGRLWMVVGRWYEEKERLARIQAAGKEASCEHDLYERGEAEPFPLVNRPTGTWDRDLSMFLAEGARAMGYTDPFFRHVCCPLQRAHEAFQEWKNGDAYGFECAVTRLQECRSPDLRIACRDWMKRRRNECLTPKSP